MCLVKMASVEEAINAITHLHRYLFKSRNIKISFTNSKI